MMPSKDIWVVGDKTIAYNLALTSKAREMADICGGNVAAFLLYEDDPQDCIRAGADEVYLLRGLCEVSDDLAIAEALAGIIAQGKPGAVLFQATVRGRAIAPAIAAILGTGLTADCIDLSIDRDGRLFQKRPALGDSILAEIICEKHRPQMATVRPGVLPEPVWRGNSPQMAAANPGALPEPVRRENCMACRDGNSNHNATGNLLRRENSAACQAGNLPASLRPVERKSDTGQVTTIPFHVIPRVVRTGFQKSRNDCALSQAQIILAGGAGIGSREGFDYLRHIASCIGGCVGASRGAVDAGYAPYQWQVGQTGVAVRPRLYIAAGISGSVQHLVGMNTSDYIIAINNDRNAPIFNYADYGIIGDWRETMDQFLFQWKEKYHEL